MRLRIHSQRLPVFLAGALFTGSAFGGRPLTPEEVAKPVETPQLDESAGLFPKADDSLPEWQAKEPDPRSGDANMPKDNQAADAPLSNNPLVELARRVAPAVVSLRSWDANGNELGRGCGFFLTEGGAILTDISVVHPDFADRIEYISVRTGVGKPYRITGLWAQNLETGFTVLHSDAADAPWIPVHPSFNFSVERSVSIVALHEEHGLTLADARIKADETATGTGWLTLRGDDSPGEPGSPVLDADGQVIALVSMRVPQGQWFNFGIQIDPVADVLEKITVGQKPFPISQLAKAKLPPVQQDQRFVEAYKALSEGRTRAATAQLVKLLKPYPRSAELWALLGIGFAKLGAKEEAASCNRKAVALDPTLGETWLQLAVNQLTPQAETSAREALEKSVVERPADRVSWLLLAEQQILANQFSAAERSLVEVLKLEPDYAAASYLLGYSKVRQGDLGTAEDALRHCVRSDRKHVQAWFLLALVCAKQQRYAEAIAAYDQVVDIQPNHPNAWRNLALLHRKLGHATQAGLAFDRHRKLGSNVAR